MRLRHRSHRHSHATNYGKAPAAANQNPSARSRRRPLWAMPSTRALRRFDPRRSPPPRQSSQAAAAAKEEEEEASPWLPSSSSTSSSSSSASALFKHSAALSAAGPRGGSGTRVYPLRDFPGGDAAALGGAFRDNVRWLLKQWSCAPGSGSAWRALLSDERTGALVPIVAVEELAAASPSPLCDLCRCAGELASLPWAFIAYLGAARASFVRGVLNA